MVGKKLNKCIFYLCQENVNCVSINVNYRNKTKTFKITLDMPTLRGRETILPDLQTWSTFTTPLVEPSVECV